MGSVCGRQANDGDKGPNLRHPDVFLKTVVHSALSSLQASTESFLQPECGIMISSVSVWRPRLMTTIFSGSCEERFHSVPEVGEREDNTDDCQDSGFRKE